MWHNLQFKFINLERHRGCLVKLKNFINCQSYVGYHARLNILLLLSCTVPSSHMLSGRYTQRNSFKILLNQTEIRLYLPLSNWFGSKQTSVWIQINWKMVNTIWFRVDFIRCRYCACVGLYRLPIVLSDMKANTTSSRYDIFVRGVRHEIFIGYPAMTLQFDSWI